VPGVLPTLYTAITSLVTLQYIKPTLHRNGRHEAHTRGSFMSGVVEVNLPRFSITPLDREDDSEFFSGLSPSASALKGGPWTIFHWECLITGSRLYRLQYSDEIQVPCAEIDFEGLISFLLKRGAVPDVKGLHMLRLAGIWTPVGTLLLLSPDTAQSAPRIALPNNSDGVLSLWLHWDKAWNNRDDHFLPPGWMRLRFPGDSEKEVPDEDKTAAMKEAHTASFPLACAQQ